MISAVILLYFLVKGEDKVEQYIGAIAIWTLFCFALTEALSMISKVSTNNLWRGWIMFDIVLFILNVLKYRKNHRQTIYSLRNKHITSKTIAWGLWAIMMVILAVKTVPYNWDSMTYHLSRIFYWVQNRTVAHYATHINRQVASPVLGEFVNLHVYAMTGESDLFVNLLQCTSYLTDGILIYYIAKKINCSKSYCVMASILFYTMPIAFAEALTTQVDNYSALWMLCFTYLILDLLDPEKKIVFSKEILFRICILALCIAFGYLAKPSVGIAMVFFALWLLVMTIKRKDNIAYLTAYLLIAGFILFVILAPEFLRNIATFGALSDPVAGERQLIGTLEPRYVLVNFLKNFTFNMPTIWLYNSTEIILKCVGSFAVLLNVDINNPTISEDGRTFSVHVAQTYGHDTAVCPLIIYLLLGCMLCFLIRNRKKGLREVRNQYFLISCSAFLTFCAVLRWEPFVSRYMISYFAILCPALLGQAELFLTEKGQGHNSEGMFKALFYFLCVTELWGLLYSHGKTALEHSRDEGYFIGRGEMYSCYEVITDIINHEEYENVGMILGYDSSEYPFLVMLDKGKRIEHVNVENVTGKYEDFSFIPDAIIVVGRNLPENCVFCRDYEYEPIRIVGENEKIYLLARKENT